MGALGDRLGHTAMLRAGMTVFGLASLAGAFAGSVGQLIAARVFMGVGGAMIMPATLAIISNIFPPEERAQGHRPLGGDERPRRGPGPPCWAAGCLNTFPGVRFSSSTFRSRSPPWPPGLFLIPRSGARVRRGVDLPGTLLSAATMFLLVFGIIKGSDVGWTRPSVWGALVLAVIGGFLFFLQEKKTEAPMLDLSLFKNPLFVGRQRQHRPIMNFAMFGMLFALTLYMQLSSRPTRPLETGLCFLPLALGYGLGSVSSNTSARRWGGQGRCRSRFCRPGGAGAGHRPLAGHNLFLAHRTHFRPAELLSGQHHDPLAQCRVGRGAPEPGRDRLGHRQYLLSDRRRPGGGCPGLGAWRRLPGRDGAGPGARRPLSRPRRLKRPRESLGAAVALADGLAAEAGQSLLLLARDSFMTGWQTVFGIICAVGLAGFFFVLKFMKAPESSSERDLD